MTQLQVTDEEACPVVADIRGVFPLAAYCAQCLIKVGVCRLQTGSKFKEVRSYRLSVL